MTAKEFYYRTDRWELKEEPTEHTENTENKKIFLENAKGGGIVLDEAVKEVLETIDGSTFDEINGKKIVSTHLLEILLKVFVRVGVLTLEKDKEEKPRQPRALEKEPLVSIVIVNYNGDKHLPDLLPSLKQQTYTRHEIIIVDNLSIDNSCQWVKTHYPDVRLLELNKNTGFAGGVNIGIREAKGDLILVLNNDIVLDENALYEMVKAAVSASLDKNKKWAAITPKMKFFNNPAFINAVGNSLYPISWGSDNFIGYVDFGQFDHVKEPLSACFGAVMLNREALEHIGLLDRRYTFYYEDMDWSIRAHIYGYRIITAPKADVYHKFGASMSLKSQTFKTRFIVGNRLYFTLKNLGRRTVRRFLFNYLLEDIKSILIYFKRKNLAMVSAYFRGYLRFFLSLPVLFFRRRRIQKQRKITGIDDASILARAAPLNLTLMEHGVPKLDVYSLRTNYAFLSSYNQSMTPGNDLIIWRLRTPKKDEKSEEKIYMEFTFYLGEPGHYDIHLLGLIKRNLTIFLDNRPIKPLANADKSNRKTKRFDMNLLAAQNIFISEGRHLLELGWRSHVHAVVLRKL